MSGAPARITAVVCTHDRPHYVAACLDALDQQTVGPDGFDIVVVDSASPPGAAEQLRALAAARPNARLIRLEEPGVSLARNAGLGAASADWVAFTDDDARPAPNWIACIQATIAEAPRPPALLGGTVLPVFEAPLPSWWPSSLRGVLSIIEWQGRGRYFTDDVPTDLEPYAVNMAVHVPSAQAVGGFTRTIGRHRTVLISDEEVQLAWRLHKAGYDCLHDDRIVVHHSIQASRMNPRWLLNRLFWQGASTALTLRSVARDDELRRRLPRRIVVAAALAPLLLVGRDSTALIGARWRLAYSLGYARAALGLLRLPDAT
jgi:glycosyltransferase involved in cell wall biosynthesis